ncbi:MAG: DUF4870 domain-containing protein [Flavobacteriales bacterium]
MPNDSEAEKASFSYLMSLVAFMAGLPLPIINLASSVFFYLGNRTSSYYVRWHCTNVLVSQFSVFLLNSIGFWWTISVLLGDRQMTDTWIAYLILVVAINLVEMIVTIRAAIRTRKGEYIRWWLISDIADRICTP